MSLIVQNLDECPGTHTHTHILKIIYSNAFSMNRTTQSVTLSRIFNWVVNQDDYLCWYRQDNLFYCISLLEYYMNYKLHKYNCIDIRYPHSVSFESGSESWTRLVKL